MKKKGKLLQIAQLGAPILRQKAKEVKNIHDESIQNIIDDMIATLRDIGGTGFSAPQIYEGLRMFIITSKKNVLYPKAPRVPVTVIINPKIISYSNEKNKNWEGCLSVPGIRALISRHNEIKVEFYDRKGIKHKATYRDLAARVFQHEYDHIEGIIYLDRLDSNKDIITEKEFQKLAKKREKARK